MIPFVNEDYQLHFDGARYAKDVEDLREQLIRLNKCEAILTECSEVVEKEVKTLSQLEAVLKAETHFKNLQVASDAFGIKAEYNSLIALQEAGFPPKKAIKRQDGKPRIKEDFLQEVKESHVAYLEEDLREDYDVLRKAMDVINSFPEPIRHSIIKRPDGVHEVNIHRYEQACRLLQKVSA
ncbi:hypothetical protein [Robiginitalea aurantiaca]|uniref:Uncharacterized protein n=1 Tax=Robiginitalea aurantiaca TaxID=3056915 RepID=A0ABT7WFA8_9FLAO|nr:hypothetical protein [Robiginitalea aurantiaca]MDM9631609.1 hypothetical protein [Robiginitalea aurantiaca]